jgi:cytochrome b6-f complex iron-sulfur subunit
MERRVVLRAAVIGGLAVLAAEGVGWVVAFARPTREPRRWFYAGHPDELPLGEPVRVSAGAFFVVRVPAGVLALSARCTHVGCQVAWRPASRTEDELGARGRFECPCHGTIYDRYGQVTAGPAPRPLDLLAVTLEHGALVVDARTVRRRPAYAPEQALPV